MTIEQIKLIEKQIEELKSQTESIFRSVNTTELNIRTIAHGFNKINDNKETLKSLEELKTVVLGLSIQINKIEARQHNLEDLIMKQSVNK